MTHSIMPVWLCPAPDQCSLSYLIQFLSNSFLAEGFLFSVCVWGCECSNWCQTMSRRARVSVVPATGASAGVWVSVITSEDQAGLAGEPDWEQVGEWVSKVQIWMWECLCISEGESTGRGQLFGPGKSQPALRVCMRSGLCVWIAQEWRGGEL